VSVITAGELYFGERDKHELKKIEKHLALLKQLPLDIDSSVLFLLLVGKFALSHKLSIPDGLIATTAIQNKLPLFMSMDGVDFTTDGRMVFTLNIKDFNYIPNLQLSNKQVKQLDIISSS
jgi:tRNA(fMet)-specific endonuclease VapC